MVFKTRRGKNYVGEGIEMPEQTPFSMNRDDREEFEAIQKRRAQERDPEYQKFQRELQDARREPSEKEQAEINQTAEQKRDIWHSYAKLRVQIADALGTAGITDFELYGAGGKRAMSDRGLEQEETLSPLEYRGALRAVGPVEDADQFINIVTNLVSRQGFKVEYDRPPSVTHLFGNVIRARNVDEIEGRPFLYIYKSYRPDWPAGHERDLARDAGVSNADADRLWGSTNVYENRVSEIACELTDDPHMFCDTGGNSIARQIGTTPDFKIIREEIKDAAATANDIQRAIHMPVRAGDHNVMIYFLAEAKHGNILIDLLGCPPGPSKDAIVKLSEMMIH